MPRRDALDPELLSPPFERFRSIRRLGTERSGHASVDHVRHQLYVGRDTQSGSNALIKVTTRPGLVYQHNLTNEIATLTTINRDLPDSRVFPVLWDHGKLRDGRVSIGRPVHGAGIYSGNPLCQLDSRPRQRLRHTAHCSTRY